ncbi:MAG: 5'-methylthioadenosine/S-adenosylhomocysteine nucleosidase [Reyranellaceae bacterium]
MLSALPEELAHLSDRGDGAERLAGLDFWRGAIAGREAVFVECGPGKVNAGLATTLLLDRFGCRALLMCGVAGGLDPALAIGDVVVGSSNLQHDYGLDQENGFHVIQPGSRPSLGRIERPGYPLAEPLLARLRAALAGLALAPLPPEVDVSCRTPAVRFGTILTGDRFVNAEATRRRLQDKFAAQAVEMEGAAVAQVAQRWDSELPVVNVRCLSDLAGRESHLDFRAFLPVAARNASLVAHRLAPAI